MLKYPLLGEKLEGTWNLALTREFDMTNDSHLFKTEPGPRRLPLYEGKMVHQFTHQWSEPRYWVDENQGRSELLRRERRHIEAAVDTFATSQNYIDTSSTRQERVLAFLKTLGYPSLTDGDLCIAVDAPRLAFRDIARNTDERTLIAAILSSEIFTGNTLNCHVYGYFDEQQLPFQQPNIKGCYKPYLSTYTLVYLCGMLNSFTLDYLVRFKVTAHVNMFYFFQLPVPRLTFNHSRCLAIATRVARLICIGPEFDELRRELLGDVDAHVATKPEERAALRAEIDGLVAHLYGLTEDEFTHVLSTFRLVAQPVKDAALAAYRMFALPPADQTLVQLIAEGENEQVEFKVAACWNARTGRKDDTMRQNIIQEVDAFLNSRQGGTVLIGVEDDGTVVGLADDYQAANAQKGNRDGYQLFLHDTLANNLEGHWSQYYTISFGMVEGKEICRIDVLPASEAVFLKNDDFYIREGNRKRKLNRRETLDYVKQRWG